MALWIPITLAAAFLQNLRSAMQKHLQTSLGTTGATFVRFGYGFPFALAYAAALHFMFGFELPRPGSAFVSYASIGGIAQILGTACLLASFRQRNFAVGTAYSKTETVQAALFGFVLLGDHIGAVAAAGIAISLAGVLALSLAKAAAWRAGLVGFARALIGRAALLGLASGAFFGISAVCYRAASLSLDSPGGDPGFLMAAGYTLAWVSFLQTVLMIGYLRAREPGQLTAIWRARRQSIWVGLAGAAASICWFTAFTLQSAAHVRAVGQVELVFTFLASTLVFRERSNAAEIAGIVMMVAGILVLLLL
ncbi:MAG: EamA family transporter [Alphaproteobacteria bacterium]|nr:EamA family transporter [Alphaproteobacteria bacterium]